MINRIEPWIRKKFQDEVKLGRGLVVLREKRSIKLFSPTTWEELAEKYSTTVESLRNLNPGMDIPRNQVFIPGRAINVSYTEDGLRWTCNKYGKLLYFKDAYISVIGRDGNRLEFPRFVGNLNKNPRVYVEPFIPKDHTIHEKMLLEDQKAEFLWTNKALRLLYGAPLDESVVA